MAKYRFDALLFDVDGTLAETEEAHRQSFNQAFGEFGLDWHWSIADYRLLLATTGGKERIRAHMTATGFERTIDVAAIHARKTQLYAAIIRAGGVRLRPGVKERIVDARQHGVALAIATTTSYPNIEALLTANLGESAMGWFDAIACGDEVMAKKPAPDVYTLALERLCIGADRGVAFEDSLNGLLSARGAGLKTIITPSIYTDDQDFSAADLVVSDLTNGLRQVDEFLHTR